MKTIESIFLLIRIKKHLIINQLKKMDTWIIIMAIGFGLYLFLSSVSISDWFNCFLSNLQNKKGNMQFVRMFNLILFVIFIANIIIPLFLEGLNKKTDLISTLIYFPFTKNKIILYSVIAELFEIFMLIFIPLYAASFLVINHSCSFIGIILLIFVIILYLLIICNLVVFIKRIFQTFLQRRLLRKILLSIFILCYILLIEIFISPPSFLKSLDITKTIFILNYLPSGVFSNYILYNFSFLNTIIYLIMLNILLFKLNLSLVGKNMQQFNPNRKEIFKKKISLKKWMFTKLKLNEYIQKDFYYLFRSPRTIGLIVLWIFLMLIIGLQIVAIPRSDHYVLLIIPNMLLYVTYSIFGINMFAYEYSGIINYYFRPISKEKILWNKKLFMDILTLTLVLFLSFVLLIGHQIPGKADLLFLISTFIIHYHICVYSSLFLSIYFPYSVNFYALSGRSISFVAMLFLLIVGIFATGVEIIFFILYLRLQHPILINVIIFVIAIILIKTQKQIIYKISKIFQQRKERIISACQ